MNKKFERLKRLQSKIDEKNLDTFIVTSSSNLFYLLGIDVSGFLVVEPNNIFLITSKFYRYSINETNIECKIYSDTEEKKQIFSNLDLGSNLSSDIPNILKELIGRDVSYNNFVTEMRTLKDDYEVNLISKSSNYTVKAFEKLQDKFKSELSEWELASIVDQEIRKLGCYNAFDTLVHSNTLRPHRSLRDKEIGNNLVIIDAGAKFEGYCSDMTRTFCIDPNSDQRELYEDVLDIYNETISVLEVGKKFSSITKQVEDIVVDKGYSLDKNFVHSLGHSLGIDIHEKPGFNIQEDRKIERGMVFTVEPGLYVEGLGGVRIEDTIYVSETGNFEVLTKFPKDLVP